MAAKRVRVLGIPGCPSCKQLGRLVRQVAEDEGLHLDLEEVRDAEEMRRLGIMSTPALEVEGNIVLSGRVPPKEELKSLVGG